MTLITYTLNKLIELNEVSTAQEMSTTWCKRNRNWYAWHKHAGSDFSVDAAINCLEHIRVRQGQVRAKRIQRELGHLEQLLADYLLREHRVAAIASCKQAQPEML